MPEANKYYITTPIYYVNARPHIGHAYSTIVCDILARRNRLLGNDTWFLTGTDEHGQKIERSAKAAGKSPQLFADEVSAQFRALWDRMGLSYDDFIRTTEPRHKRGVQKLFAELQKRGFIYKGSYSGQYCVFDELYVDTPPGVPCPDCGRPTETVTEENYFFKLSAFERKLLDHYETEKDFIRPGSSRKEVISFVKSGLRDLSVSRTSFNWGIPVPGDEKHVIYVWLDALANYVTAVGYGSDAPEDIAQFQKYWPADLHLVGKEITRFHCVYWPAFLMAAGLPLPKSITANGWLLFEESKMSKSRGNIVRAETILERFGALKPELDKKQQDLFGTDVLRYFLLREIPFGQDGSFSFDAVVQRYNGDLANGYGNLVSRVLRMIENQFDSIVPESDEDIEVVEGTKRILFGGGIGPIKAGMDFDALPILPDLSALSKSEYVSVDFAATLSTLLTAQKALDSLLSQIAPWNLARDPKNRPRVATTLSCAAECIRWFTALLYPFLPYSTAKVWTQLGLGDIEEAAKEGHLKDLQWKDPHLKPNRRMGERAVLFPSIKKEEIPNFIKSMTDIEENNAPANRPATPVDPNASGSVQATTTTAPSTPTPEALNAVAPEAKTAATPNAPAAAPAVQPQPIPDATPKLPGIITIDDFAKVELRVAQIKVAERIPKADKLLRLEVDLGYEQRQILAGIAEHYTPESLIGRKIVIIANLAPRKMRGFESNGMLLAASLGEAGKPVLAGFLEDVPLGARLK